MRKFLAFFMAILGILACACVFGTNMVLTPADLGDQYPALPLNSAESGPQTRDQVINAACDPKKQAVEMDETHWVAEYVNEYDSPSGALRVPVARPFSSFRRPTSFRRQMVLQRPFRTALPTPWLGPTQNARV